MLKMQVGSAARGQNYLQAFLPASMLVLRQRTWKQEELSEELEDVAEPSSLSGLRGSTCPICHFCKHASNMVGLQALLLARLSSFGVWGVYGGLDVGHGLLGARCGIS